MTTAPARKVLLASLLGLLSCNNAAGGRARDLQTVRLPPGFSISVFTDKTPGARSLALGDKGTVFVGSQGEGKVYAVRDTDGDGRADEVRTVAAGLDTPNGVAFHNGNLYVGQVWRILRYDGIEARLLDPPQPQVVIDTLPKDAHHGWKFIRFGPDGYLYVPVGAPCNVCKREDARYASILRMRPDGSELTVHASGIRNTVGFDWQPGTAALWFTDNGRDMLGDDIPPDELNRVERAGQNFGFPHCHGGDIADPEFGAGHPCSGFTPPAQKLGPHVAALGMRFYTGAMFPAAYRGQIFLAEHGSWNRSKPIGYRVSLVRVKDGQALGYEPFAEGFLQGDKAWGRPVDVLVMPDGALLVSDDRGGAIYRISYRRPG